MDGTSNKALIVTHGSEMYGADEDEIEVYLEENAGGFDGVFYVGFSYSERPWSDLSGFDVLSSGRCDLPPGFDQGFYDRGLAEVEDGTGIVEPGEVDDLVDSYDVFGVCGAREGVCVENTVESFINEDEEILVYTVDEVLY